MNSFYVYLIFASLGILFTSCSKADILNADLDQVNIGTRNWANRIYYDPGEGLDAYCYGANGNCLPDVVITAKKRNMIVDLERSINETIASSTGAILTNYYEDAVDVFTQILVDGVINGSLHLSMMPNADGSTKHWILKDTSDNIVNVVPTIE